MIEHEKFRLLIIPTIALAAIILLSAGLSGVELLPGQPFSVAIEPLLEEEGMAPAPVSESLSVFIRVFFTIALLSSPFLIFYFIVSPEFRKRVLGSLIPLLWMYTLYIVLKRLPPNFFLDGATSPAASQPGDFPLGTTADFVANSPSWFTFVAIFGIAVLLNALFVGAAWFIWRRRQRPPEQSSLEQLAQGAQDALESLQAGGDMKSVVLHCYFEMAQVLNEQRGIERQSDVTPSEFAYRLEKAGLPGEHVRRLTRLFESVRYGAKTLDEDEERQAVACLTAIVEACGEAA